MENEVPNNNADYSALLKEIQILNEGVVSNGERLTEISEFLIAKDKAENLEKEENLKKQEEEKLKNEEVEKENQVKASEETDTYTELLTDVRDQMVLTNNILSGQVFFMGVIFGILLLKILWDRFIR